MRGRARVHRAALSRVSVSCACVAVAARVVCGGGLGSVCCAGGEARVRPVWGAGSRPQGSGRHDMLYSTVLNQTFVKVRVLLNK